MNTVTLGLTRKSAFAAIIIFSLVIVIDSTIVKYFSYSEVTFTRSTNLWIFIFLSLVFIVGITIFLNSVGKIRFGSVHDLPIAKRYFHTITICTLGLAVVIVVTTIIQMILLGKYSIFLLYSITYLTHFTSLFFLIFLSIIFIGWMRARRNYVLLLYILAFMLLSINIIISFVYLNLYFSSWYSPDVGPYPIDLLVTQILPSPWNERLGLAFDILSICSFFLTWTATCILLFQYRYKFGRIKYFIILSIPLVYYLFPFAEYFANIFSPFMLESPVVFGVTFTIIFSGTRQFGALLFSIAFLTSSALVTNDGVRKSLLLSAIGMAILFGSVELTSLKYAAFPPYGVITEVFMPIGSYLLLIGIFTSATFIARDAELRREFHKSAKGQLTLLRTIGVIQMEKELIKKFKSMEKRAISTGKIEESYREEEEVKQLVHEVIDELNKTKNKKHV